MTMRLVDHVIGGAHDDALGEALHRLEHRSQLDVLGIERAEQQRRRFRAKTKHGEDVAVALPRDETLYDGAVLVLEPDYALVVRLSAPRWLVLRPRDAATALELGYHAGNLHWRVKFDGGRLLVALEGPADVYRARIAQLVDGGAVAVEETDA